MPTQTTVKSPFKNDHIKKETYLVIKEQERQMKELGIKSRTLLDLNNVESTSPESYPFTN